MFKLIKIIMMKSTKIILSIAIVLAAIVGGFLLFNKETQTSQKPDVKNTLSKTQSPTVQLTGETKEFRIEAFQFGFSPSVIEVNLGDTVKIIASSRDVPHSFTLPDFGVNLYLDGLNTKTAEFIADKAGTFTFYCNIPCGGGHSSMRGTFKVIK